MPPTPNQFWTLPLTTQRFIILYLHHVRQRRIVRLNMNGPVTYDKAVCKALSAEGLSLKASILIGVEHTLCMVSLTAYVLKYVGKNDRSSKWPQKSLSSSRKETNDHANRCRILNQVTVSNKSEMNQSWWSYLTSTTKWGYMLLLFGVSPDFSQWTRINTCCGLMGNEWAKVTQ